MPTKKTEKNTLKHVSKLYVHFLLHSLQLNTLLAYNFTIEPYSTVDILF